MFSLLKEPFGEGAQRGLTGMRGAAPNPDPGPGCEGDTAVGPTHGRLGPESWRSKAPGCLHRQSRNCVQHFTVYKP